MEKIPILIPVKGGHFAMVDPEDAPLVAGRSWYLNETGYAMSRIKGKLRRMHRWILGEPEGIVDHRNHNPLDNRKENLRVTTQKKNAQNGLKRNKKRSTSSIYKGVYWDNEKRKWRVSVGADWRRVYTGIFESERLAGIAYNIVSSKIHGEFSYPNDIDATEDEIKLVTESILKRKCRGGSKPHRLAPAFVKEEGKAPWKL